ncbi:GH1 family beta-glucosidase [Plesiomonas sp.]|uniref:GH1 family beta-glucosidase n=1 Tax=Plesiomonas sp. TaxID=2486279 RepID=UPI003F3440A1
MTTYTFPEGFIWGSATAALQIEGAAREEGRGLSQWDVFCHEHPERIYQQATPDIACDHYHRYRDDVRLMKEIGHNGYRLSISWPRLIPTEDGQINPQGVDFYNNLFDALLAEGIEPNVTLYHWDLPVWLADEGGWENPKTLDAYLHFAKTCFTLFGDRVKRWATFNEPAWTTLNGYVTALHPPCKHDYRAAIQVAHHFVLAHARAVKLFRALNTGGEIGLVLNMSTVYPATDKPEDIAAAHLADGMLNRWFIDPALLGHYPQDVVDFYQQHNLLPEWDEQQLRDIAETKIDFIGVNYYYPHYATADATDTEFHINNSGNNSDDCKFSIAGVVRFVKNPNGKYTDWGWEIAPQAMYDLLQRAHEYAPGIPVYVTENGIGMQDQLNADGSVDDDGRIDFVREHLKVIHQAVHDGINVRGYYMWSLMDNFSWINGFKKRYGFLYIDRETQQRYKKKSAYWYAEVAAKNGFDE